MKRLTLILLSLALSCVFMFYSPSHQMGFPFSEVVMPAENWFFYFFEHLILVILAVVILDLEHTYRIAAITFLCIQIVDTVDYCLTYGEPWFEGPLTWNIIKVSAYGVAFAVEIEKHHARR